jgi:hypothetical protein
MFFIKTGIHILNYVSFPSYSAKTSTDRFFKFLIYDTADYKNLTFKVLLGFALTFLSQTSQFKEVNYVCVNTRILSLSSHLNISTYSAQPGHIIHAT